MVTGASSGIGLETSRALAHRGAHVVMAVRNLDKGAAAVAVDGSFSFRTDIVIDRPTTYLESRLQIRNPGGSLAIVRGRRLR